MNSTILQRFVVLEGLDGAGTTTQMKLLADRLGREGIAHHATFEPTDGAVGRMIREVLAKKLPAQPRTVALLFAADRSEHLASPATGIEARTGRGELVVCDRYLFSSLAYQSQVCEPRYVQALNASFPLPQLLVFIDTPVRTCQQRLELRGKAELYDGFAFQGRVRGEYLEVFEKFRDTGMKIAVLPGDRPAGIIHGEIWNLVSQLPIRKA